jgi:hypothetical protein
MDDRISIVRTFEWQSTNSVFYEREFADVLTTQNTLFGESITPAGKS